MYDNLGRDLCIAACLIFFLGGVYGAIITAFIVL